MESVKAWMEKLIIPTYKTGKPDKNPMFLENRVYQGTSGVVYPHPVIDKVYDEKEDKTYQAVFLENEYLKVMILPEIGGRIQMAFDKTNNYHFIYYNQVIKPALVGLAGPWISGGVEFNWPQHHRPSTFDPVDFSIDENEDGSKTVWVHEIEMMFHTEGAAGFTLYPDEAYLEVKGRLYNRTLFPQTFLWWANPAVQVDEYYQSVFPPDVNAVYDHGRRDVSSFPIATGTYYKVDYSPGTDISRYQNIPVPTSYMAEHSIFDFVGGYHHRKKAGMLHIADHHISPGKKQWTWGSGEFGKMWDKQLTDSDGPYFEMMAGVFTDNQPDFSWIMPNEERIFNQYFLPYKDIGYVKNANKDAAVNVEISPEEISVMVYVTATQKDIHISLTDGDISLLEEKTDLSPLKTFSKTLLIKNLQRDKLLLKVTDSKAHLLISYQPSEKKQMTIPEPAKAIESPSEIKTTEELFLAGLHLEQYRHATYSPVDYFKEALKRDPSDIRCNNGLGLWYLKHGQFTLAEPFFKKAIEKLTLHNPNPYNGEPYYNLGMCLTFQGKWQQAYDAFYKSSWNAAWQDNAFLQLAYIDCRRHQWKEGLEHVEQSLSRNFHGLKARHLKSVILRKMGKPLEACGWSKETLAINKFDYGSRYELSQDLMLLGKEGLAEKEIEDIQSLTGGKEQTYIEIAIDYARGGFYDFATRWLRLVVNSGNPMVCYYLAYYLKQEKKETEKEAVLKKGGKLSSDYVFPNRLEDITVLEFVNKENQQDYKSLYYLGNLWYDKRQYKEAEDCWKKSVALNEDFPTTHRNLGIFYYNKLKQSDNALKEYEKAFACNPGDARILFELDQLYKLTNRPLKDRLSFLQKHDTLVRERDDLYVEFITLNNLLGNYERAMELLNIRRFHPWEGGEGKVTKQYVYTEIALGFKAMQGHDYNKAILHLTEARHYPENLGEGKLYGMQENNIFYWLGCAFQSIGKKDEAEIWWNKAAAGSDKLAEAVYYNDQDPAMIFFQGLALRKLKKTDEAKQRFESLVEYGKTHLDKKVTIDFFAVSLPELSVFDTDWDRRNRTHCHFLLGLGYGGLNKKEEAERHFRKVLEGDISHQGAINYFNKGLDDNKII